MIYVVESGEWSETLVVSPVELEEATDLGKIVTDWLAEQSVIEPSQWHNIFGPVGHAAGAKASVAHEETAEEPKYDLVEIWASGEATKGEGIIVIGNSGPIMMRCPECSARQGFFKVVLDSWEAEAKIAPQCNSCGRTESFDRWDGEGDFACARLTITFNRWPPITALFKQELAQLLGRQIRTVIARA